MLPQAQHHILEDLAARPRWPLTPQRVDEPIGAQRLVRPCGERRQHDPVVAARERDIAGWITYLKRTQNGEMNRSKSVQPVIGWDLRCGHP